jgi:hypothetical protein
MSTGSFHDAESRATEAVLERFNRVFLTHDRAALSELVAQDCVIELWTKIATMPGAHFETETIIARGDRGEIR